MCFGRILKLLPGLLLSIIILLKWVRVGQVPPRIIPYQSANASPHRFFGNWRNIPKHLHKFRSSWNKTLKAFWTSIRPTVNCKKENLRRLGRAGDGGKWTCGLTKAGGPLNNDESRRPCVVFSFGVKDDSTFESDLLRHTTCNIFAYDPSVEFLGAPFPPYSSSSSNPRIRFQKLAVGGHNRYPQMATIKGLMEKTGVEWIDILKMDIDEDEYATLSRFLDDFQEVLPVGQLLVEFHFVPGRKLSSKVFPTDRADSSVLPILEGLEGKGLQLFHTEWLPQNVNHMSEFSFINTNVHDDFVELPNA